MVKRILALIAVYLWLAAAAIAAQGALAISGAVPAETMTRAFTALRDPGRQMGIARAVAAARAGEFKPVEGSAPDFGYTPDVIWLRLPLVNDSAAVRDWRLRLDVNFFQSYAAYQVAPDGSITTLERLTPESPFSARQVDYPELVTAFQLPPGQATTLYFRYWSGGSSQLNAVLETAAGFERFAASRTAKNFTYYGMVMFLILAALVAWGVTGQSIFAAYGAYAVSGLLFIMHGDGNAFRYLWPNAPLFNGFASLVLGGGIIVFGANFARQFLLTRIHHPVMDKLLLGVIALTLAMIVATLVVDTQMIKKWMVLVATLSIALFTVSGLVAARTRWREVRFYVLAWGGAVISSALMTARHWLGIEISAELQYDSMRLVIVVDAAMMGLAILDRINQLKRARQVALEASLREARHNLDLSRRLRELEQDYGLAVELSRSHERRFADAIHDLRTPLHALRLHVNALVSGRETAREETAAAPDVEETFRYLEQLIGQELQAHGSGGLDAARQDLADGAAPEVARIDDILARTHEMFLPDAEAKGLRLRYVPCHACAGLPPLDLMRIVSNLVSNAIKFTERGTVLIGVRRRGGALRLEVHDTGPGLSQAEFDAAIGRSVRLRPEVAGAGLGLSILREMAATHGLDFGLIRPRAGGTSLYVTLPPAAVPA
ncbi:sensor histidine kinase [Acidimangrovimonas pyrenivorans]|uniref:histidine kinase n=1 Tax=Acidimangrovimonas pyrenivorans TaxID=2030798 RepID=A0ABV7AF72_9RHOB